MRSVREAREQILSHFQPIPDWLLLPIEQADGYVLARDLHTDAFYPPFNNSSVDGYALRAEDCRQTPVILQVVEDIPAGVAPQKSILPGQAARIMTGAMLPEGADAIVMVENTNHGIRATGEAAPHQVQVLQAVKPGENIRPRGMDLAPGSRVLQAGHRLRPQEIGLLAMLGLPQVEVTRPPHVAVLSSGDELLPPDQPLQPGKIHDSNSYSLAGLARRAGCKVTQLGVAPDNLADITALLNSAVRLGVDVILSSAGVSVGAFDYVKAAIEQNGQLEFWKVNMRPGKPLAFGAYQNIPFFGLPGNPVSAFIGFMVFVQPALERLSGLQTEELPRVSAILEEAVESDGRESYLRAILQTRDGIPHARLTGHQGSGNLFSLVQANALLIIPSGVKSLAPGARVEAWPIG